MNHYPSSKEIAQNEPDAWVPGVFGIMNISQLRAINQARWEGVAKRINSSRNVFQILRGEVITSPADVMLTEALELNTKLDADYPEVPNFLARSRYPKVVLAIAGIQEAYFSNADDLHKAIGETEIPFGECIDRAIKASRQTNFVSQIS